jgi:hypothetical protein
MDHLKSSSPAATAARAIPTLALPPHDLVTDYMLRKYAQVDPMQVADGDDKELLAALAMILPDICGELLA